MIFLPSSSQGRPSSATGYVHRSFVVAFQPLEIRKIPDQISARLLLDLFSEHDTAVDWNLSEMSHMVDTVTFSDLKGMILGKFVGDNWR
jgi:hypothetical protein